MSQTVGENKKKEDREWLILLLSILSALIIWLMHNLSMTYSVFLEYEVDMNTSLQGRSKTSSSEEVLIIRGKADGYYIIAQRFGRKSKLELEIAPEDLVQRVPESDIFYVSTSNLTGNIVAALDEDVELEFVVTDKLDFVIPRMVSKRVPVVPRLLVEYSGQYMPVGDIFLKPDSVDIYGEVNFINAIDSVWTETLYHDNVNASLNGVLDIVPQRKVQYSSSSVYYSINVARYVVETVTVPVLSSGMPDNKDMIILPSKIEVTYRRFFGGSKLGEDDFRFVVNYDDYLHSINSRVVPVWENMPEGIIKYEIRPKVVDCIVTQK